jgi:hypothetical protein
MNGEISVQSTKGIGSTFSITLPCIIDEVPPVIASPSPNYNQASTTLINALIVDDNLVNRYKLIKLN